MSVLTNFTSGSPPGHLHVERVRWAGTDKNKLKSVTGVSGYKSGWIWRHLAELGGAAHG